MTEFFPHFQPIVDIPSGRISGYEALARERLASGSVRSCGPYFADENVDKRFLLDIDRKVRNQALAAVSKLPEDTFISLNISPEWIANLSTKCDIPTLKMIDELAVDPKRILIEITETKGDMRSIERLVKLYRRYGMRIAVDDFGAGYSELGRVVALEPDLIKLDMRFFKSAITGGIAYDAVRAISFMAERIGSEILCEGVESEQEFNFAVDCGANLIQGFLFYKPGAEFIAPEDSKPLVESKLQNFLASKIGQEKQHIHYYQSILAHAHRIKAQIEDTDSPALASLPTAPEGFVRFYVCQQDGRQLSPNYDYYQNQWHAQPEYMGLNWSGRPYLHQVIALSDIVARDEIASRPYRDRLTRRLFQTQGLRLADGRILLVDFLAEP